MKEAIFTDSKITEKVVEKWNKKYEHNPFERCHCCDEELNIRRPVPDSTIVFCQECIDASKD